MGTNNDDRLVTIRTHDRDPYLAYLDTPPTLASTMGRFRPARFVGARRGAYVVHVDQLDAFRRFAELAKVAVIDNRENIGFVRPLGRERPLPECAFCGQPTRRGSRFIYCPNCGEEWHPIEPIPYAEQQAAITQCRACGKEQTRGFAHCGHCGAELDDEPIDDEPTWQQRRGQLDEPLTIGAIIEELPIELPLTPP